MKKAKLNETKDNQFVRSKKKTAFFVLPLATIISLCASGCTVNWNDFLPNFSSSESKSSSINESSSEQKESQSSSDSSVSSNESSSSSDETKEFDEISFYFISAGTSSDALFNGDSIYIKAGNNDILIDAGPKAYSAKNIKKVIDEHCDDNKLEYVIATHAHADHLPGFYGTSPVPGIFKTYDIGTIIDFPKTSATTVTYSNYVTARDEAVKKGAKHYTALDCYSEKDGASKTYVLGDGLSMEVLYQKYYETSTSNENNYSVCLLFKQGDKKMLFTGDLEDEGIDSLCNKNELGKVDLFKGGHHGSFNANPDSFLSIIQPDTICTCCVAGSTEYTTYPDHTMPYQETIDAWAKYTDDVYVTNWATSTTAKTGGELNGTIAVKYDKNGTKTVSGSNNSLKLKDTEWLKENRKIPSSWN